MFFKDIRIVTLAIIFSVSGLSSFYGQNQTTGSGNLTGESIWFAEWYNDSKSAFSFSFDDGFISQYENVRPILNQFDFNGSFYVMPPFLTDSLPGIWRYGTWPMFTTMSLEGHEIGSHTMNHLHLTTLEAGDTSQEGTILYEIYQSRELINQRLPNQKCITLAYPYAEHNSLVDSLTSLYYESARADGLQPNNSSVPDSLWHSLSAIEVMFDGVRTSLADDLDELEFIKNWIDSSISRNTWGILLTHEVVPQDSLPGLISAGAYEPYSNEWFTLLCEWVDTKSFVRDIWVETVANVTRYVKERDNAYYSLVTYNDMQIQIMVDDDLNDDIYDYHLSTFIKVPSEWQFALFTQDQYTDTLEVFENDSGRVVLAEIHPNSSMVTLDKIVIDGLSNNDAEITDFNLYQNYPNPFNPETNIQFSIIEEANVKLTIYDILANEIADIVNEEKAAGFYTVSFYAKGLSSGIYFYTLQSAGRIEMRKMIIIK